MKIYICFLILAGLACGCKKSEFVLDYSGIKPVMIIPNGNWPLKSPYDPQPLDSLFGVQQLKLYARVSYATALDKPVKVTFKEDLTILDDYNTKWGTSYKALPKAATRKPEAKRPCDSFPDATEPLKDLRRRWMRDATPRSPIRSRCGAAASCTARASLTRHGASWTPHAATRS